MGHFTLLANEPRCFVSIEEKISVQTSFASSLSHRWIPIHDRETTRKLDLVVVNVDCWILEWDYEFWTLDLMSFINFWRKLQDHSANKFLQNNKNRRFYASGSMKRFPGSEEILSMTLKNGWSTMKLLNCMVMMKLLQLWKEKERKMEMNQRTKECLLFSAAE